jgi:hypothetical protein
MSKARNFVPYSEGAGMEGVMTAFCVERREEVPLLHPGAATGIAAAMALVVLS